MSGSQVGTVQTLVVCVPSQVEQAPCPSGMGLTTVQGYIIDPAQAASINALPPAEDVAAIWSVGFSLVVVCYLVGRGVGVCIELIRKG